MKAEIITIGDEILNGQIVDTNSAWIAQRLAPLQIHLVQITSISDTKTAIIDALTNAAERANLIIVTGGLGPTKDDVTKHAAATYFNTTLINDTKVLEHVRGIFRNAGFEEMPAMNVHQADVLANAKILFNDVGTAPGMWVAKDGKFFAFLPGVPFEMKFLIENRVIPELSGIKSETTVHNAYILTTGIGESHLADRIADIEEDLPEHIHLAYLPKIGMVKLRLTAVGNNQSILEEETQLFVERIVSRVGKHVLATEDIGFEEVLVKRFTEAGCTLATAESCTGGAIASLITSVPGASAMFNGAVVAYANAAKMHMLGVEEETLKSFGAVSESTVRQMAEGAKSHLGTDYAIATSGIAGPGGGTAEKPVGTVWVAVAGRQATEARAFYFKNDRMVNIERSVTASLQMLWDLFQKEQ